MYNSGSASGCSVSGMLSSLGEITLISITDSRSVDWRLSTVDDVGSSSNLAYFLNASSSRCNKAFRFDRMNFRQRLNSRADSWVM